VLLKSIGVTTIVSLASEGAMIMVNCASSAESASKVVEKIKSNGAAIAVPIDKKSLSFKITSIKSQPDEKAM
jgi:hypothetical protein